MRISNGLGWSSPRAGRSPVSSGKNYIQTISVGFRPGRPALRSGSPVRFAASATMLMSGAAVSRGMRRFSHHVEESVCEISIAKICAPRSDQLSRMVESFLASFPKKHDRSEKHFGSGDCPVWAGTAPASKQLTTEELEYAGFACLRWTCLKGSHRLRRWWTECVKNSFLPATNRQTFIAGVWVQ
jgi:hypothetical protein